ncbi:hypothetical protein [Paraferrimonas haliotis]|uniref:hypothetical protein n=1 Tax=Paraferrimonas haliotis TaxID=2013866 RepID=UPI000BA936F0|nr:hypothetical protein [Paraferrimonas haliotis]
MNLITIDFSKYPSELWSGRKNGIQAQKRFLEGQDNDGQCKIKLKANESQVITSSFYLGLLEDRLLKYSSINNVLNNVEFEGINEESQKEFLNAVKRNLFKSGSVF